MFAVPNGGGREMKEAIRLKAEGVLPGVPDIFIANPAGGYHGLFIEMKRAEGGRLSDAQRKIIEALREAGYRVAVCYGADDAWDVLCSYVGDN